MRISHGFNGMICPALSGLVEAQPEMHGHEKSDLAIVAVKPTNNAECEPTKHALGSEPDKRDTGRWLVYGIDLPSTPEVGAVCGKAARTVLVQRGCGTNRAARRYLSSPFQIDDCSR